MARSLAVSHSRNGHSEAQQCTRRSFPLSSAVGQWCPLLATRSYLDDQEDVCRGVCDGEDGRASQGGDGCVGDVGLQQALHLIGVQVKVEVL